MNNQQDKQKAENKNKTKKHMYINTHSKIFNDVIDFLFDKAWFMLAVLLTISALAVVWAVGLLTILSYR